MFCKSCGAQIEDGTKFCPNCGAEQTVEAPQPAAPAYTPAPDPNAYNPNAYNPAPTYNPAPAYAPAAVPVNVEGLATSSMIFGIIAMCLPALFAIIFGAVAKSKAKAYGNATGAITGKAKVGNILGTIALIFGIIATIAVVIYVIAVIIIAIAGAAAGGLNSIDWYSL